MQHGPRVSIIIPIYNAQEFLPRLFDDIKNQTFRDFECILINDGSKDSSLALCQDTALNDSRFIVVDKENEGVSATRNRGLKESKGQFVAFVDSDDRLNPHYLEYLWSGVKPCVDVVVCRRKIIFNHEIMPISRGNVKTKTEDCGFATYLTNSKIGFQVPTFVWGHLYRKSKLHSFFHSSKDVGFEDCYFNIENLPSFRKVSFVYAPLYGYLVRKGSLCKTRSLVQKSTVLSAKALIGLCDSFLSEPERFSELSPYVFHTVSAFSSLIISYSLYKDEEFALSYSNLFSDIDRYFSYWKTNKKRMEWFVYKVFWGFLYKYTKRKISRTSSSVKR